MDILPSPDSPKHILNALNDDCIDEIFRRLTILDDFLSASGVCQRFSVSGKRRFRFQFKGVSINHNEKAPNNLRPERVLECVRLFGPMIQALSFESTFHTEHNDYIFETISNYCGRTLKDLSIYDCNPNFEYMHFEALEYLYLNRASPQHFQPESSLKILSLEQLILLPSPSWFLQKMPQLEELHINSVKHVTDEMLAHFLSLNPQVQRIHLGSCRHLTPSIFAHLSPCLVELGFYNLHATFSESVITEMLNSLRTFKKLKHLYLLLPKHNISLTTIINTLAENNMPVERLSINTYEKYLGLADENMLTLKTLKHLEFVLISNHNIFDNLLIKVIKSQTALETIDVNCYGMGTMTMIKKILKYGKNLAQIQCKIGGLNIDLENYKSVLRFAKNRVNIKLTILPDGGRVDVPEHIINENRQWLDIVTLNWL